MQWAMNNKGQTLFEHAAVIVFIVAALMAMQFYGRRALQGRLRTSFDQVGEQYEIGQTGGQMTTAVNQVIETEVQAWQPLTVGGKDGFATVSTERIIQDETTRSGSETVGEFGSTLWE